MSTKRSLSVKIYTPLRTFCPKDYFVFSFYLKSGCHHVDIFLCNGNIWFSPWIFVSAMQDIFCLLFYLSVFQVMRILFLLGCKTIGNLLEVERIRIATFCDEQINSS